MKQCKNKSGHFTIPSPRYNVSVVDLLNQLHEEVLLSYYYNVFSIN